MAKSSASFNFGANAKTPKKPKSKKPKGRKGENKSNAWQQYIGKK